MANVSVNDGNLILAITVLVQNGNGVSFVKIKRDYEFVQVQLMNH